MTFLSCKAASIASAQCFHRPHGLVDLISRNSLALKPEVPSGFWIILQVSSRVLKPEGFAHPLPVVQTNGLQSKICSEAGRADTHDVPGALAAAAVGVSAPPGVLNQLVAPGRSGLRFTRARMH